MNIKKSSSIRIQIRYKYSQCPRPRIHDTNIMKKVYEIVMRTNQNRHEHEQDTSPPGSNARKARAGSVCAANTSPRPVLRGPTPITHPHQRPDHQHQVWHSAHSSNACASWKASRHRPPYKPSHDVQQNQGETAVSPTPKANLAA
jgi:hypothetical protein